MIRCQMTEAKMIKVTNIEVYLVYQGRPTVYKRGMKLLWMPVK